MADQSFPAIDGLGALVEFLAWVNNPGDPLIPYRKFTPADLAALTNGMSAIVDAVNEPSSPSVTPTNRNNQIATGTAEDVFPGGANPVNVRFRNVGPNDAYYQVGATATGVFSAGDKQINVGESVTLPYRTDEPISFFSTLGTNIEGEEW